jgi:hypothetical protein
MAPNRMALKLQREMLTMKPAINGPAERIAVM